MNPCKQCPLRARPCGGACPCTVDGRDIRAHRDAGYCPEKKFGDGIKPVAWDDVPVVQVGQVIPPKPTQPVPRDQWPLIVRGLAMLATEADKGVGDTLARLLAHVGGEKYKRITKRLGYDCKCSAGQANLNALYGYGAAPSPAA
jgi:hypothetical protein